MKRALYICRVCGGQIMPEPDMKISDEDADAIVDCEIGRRGVEHMPHITLPKQVRHDAKWSYGAHIGIADFAGFIDAED